MSESVKRPLYAVSPVIYTLDDEPLICEILAEILESEGLKVFSFTEPGAFFQAISESSPGPDLVILDVHMPELNGLEVCNRVKEIDLNNEIPVLFLTGQANHKDAVSGFRSGAVDYITKPFDRHELLARIHTHLQLRFARKTLEDQNRKLTELNERYRKLQKILFRNVPFEVHRESLQSLDEGRFDLTESRVRRSYLFADLVGFTSFSEKNTPENILENINRILRPATDLIYKFNGDVNNFIGDCIFAVFDDPLRAADCAVEIQKLARQENSFSLRVGLTFGDSIRCNVGSLRRSGYTYIGKTVNLAQRLQSVAGPGEILCSEEFAAMVGFSRFAEARIMPLKGFSTAANLFPLEFSAESRGE